jgi:hypothetical protein
MHSLRLAIAPFVLVVIMLAGGCASSRESVSLRKWQGDLQKYVNQAGNGDMSALRSTQVTPDRPGFRVFSNDRAEDSNDIAGVLIGATEYDGRLWYLYLVGEMKKEVLQGIHAVAVSQQALRYEWREGPRDPAALAAYRAHLDTLWREAHPDHAQPPRGTIAFPSSADAFEYIARGDMITIREKNSGAEWNVDLDTTDQR